MLRLSALVCVQNHEARLSACLRSLAFCDEIVVVADRCTDSSREIARRAGAVIVDGIFPLEDQRRGAGLAACSGDWILEVEPDEEIDTALAWEIRAALRRPPVGDWFELPIDNYVGDDLVRRGWTGALSERSAVRLYRPGAKRWASRRVDCGLPSGAPAGALNGAIRRRLGADVGGLLERLNRRAACEAEDLAEAAARGLPSAAGAFVRSYVAAGGWREGRVGLLVAVLSALHPWIVRLRAREIVQRRSAALTDSARPAGLREFAGVAAR